MIVATLKKEQECPALSATVRVPDENWKHTRSDGVVVRWEKHGEHWFVLGLVHQYRLTEPQYADGEQYNEGETEEYYFDPYNGEEVKPGYVTREQTRRIAGRVHYECTAWLTADEMAWMTPKGELPRTTDYKRTVVACFMGSAILLRGVWSGHVLEQRDDLVHIELHVDKIEAVKIGLPGE